MTETPDALDVATFRLGYKNILGSNWTRRTANKWSRRKHLLQRELTAADGMRASVYFFVEVNRWPERWGLRRMLRGWSVVRSKGSNNAYANPRKHRVLAKNEFPLPSSAKFLRMVTIVKFQHVETGIVWTGATTHLTSSVSSNAELATAARTIEANELVALCDKHKVDVLAADLNNSSDRPGTPRHILSAAGYTDWRSVIDVKNVEYDTHYGVGQVAQRDEKHIDAIYFGPRVTGISGRVQITEPGASDHFGLVATISIER